MKAEKTVNWIDAVSLLLEFGTLNLDTCLRHVVDRKVEELRRKEWSESARLAAIFELLWAADCVACSDHESEQEQFDLVFKKTELQNWTLTYRGQFTSGRYIHIEWDADAGDAGVGRLEAETGTDLPSRYFAKFRGLTGRVREVCNFE